MHFKKVLSCFFVSFFLLFSLSIQAKELSHQYQISWPEGWKISTSNRKDTGVKNAILVTATKIKKDRTLAVISVHELTRNDHGKVDLKYEFKVAKSTLVKTLTHAGFKVKKSKITTDIRRGLKGYKTIIEASVPKLSIIQEMSMYLTDKCIFSIGVVKLKQNMDEVTQREIDKTLESIDFVK